MSLEWLPFLRPLWLLALLGLPLLPWLWRRSAGQHGGWARVVDAHLLQAQLQRGATRRHAPLLLAMAAYLLGVLALAGPAWRLAPQPLQEREAALAIVLELSDSMRAGDLKPDRLARARFALIDLLRQRRDGQFALVAYAGSAFTVAPVTDDAATLLALLDALDPGLMPVSGADAGRGLRHAASLLADAGHPLGEILLVADGATAADVSAAQEVHALGYVVHVLGVGTPAGAPVPLPEGGFLKDEAGSILVPTLDAEALAEVADAGGGRYRSLQGSGSELAALGLLDADSGRYADSEDARTQLVDDGPWLLLLLVPLAALGFRRGWLGCVLVLAFLPPPAQAVDWSALWQRAEQRAWQALQAGEPAEAAQLARSPALRGSALYRAGEHAAAAEAFAAAEGADAHYNRGNALAREQRFEDALAAYDAALALQPGMEDAIANRKAVEEWLKRQQSQQDQSDAEQEGEGDPQQGQQGQQQGNQQGEQQGEPQQGDQQQEGDASGADGQPREGEGEQSGEGDDQGEAGDQQQPEPGSEQAFGDAMEQALQQAGQAEQPAPALDPAEAGQRQAVEQWLRRVPDDPGGLLRRKFLLEHQRRLREGEQQ